MVLTMVLLSYLGDFGVLGLVLDACGWPYFDLQHYRQELKNVGDEVEEFKSLLR